MYRSPECRGYAELEQTWKYISTQCCISFHPCRSIRKQRRTCIKNTQILHAATARLFLRKVSGIVVVYESGINLTCCPISELKIDTQVRKKCVIFCIFDNFQQLASIKHK